MNLRNLDGVGFIPTYTRTPITNALHTNFNFRTDTEITTLKEMKKILNLTKK